MALKFVFCLTFLLLVASKVVCRNLKSDSDQEHSLVVVDHVDAQSPSPSLDLQKNDSCVKIYGFLPCADNVGGYIFQIFIFECLLVGGDFLLSKGNTHLFRILGVGIYGGIVFRILMALSRNAVILASGFSVSDIAAQLMVDNSVGSLAGSIVFSLSVQWGLCILFGRTDITKESNPHGKNDTTKGPTSTQSLFKKLLSSLTESGIKVDLETKRAAGIMLLSFIPIFIVEVSVFVSSSSWSRKVHLISLILLILALLSYFAYQFLDPSVQQRSLDYSNYEHLIADFLTCVAKHAQDKLVTDDGEPNLSVIQCLFDKFDTNQDKSLSKPELGELLLHIKSSDLQADEAYALGEFMKVFDSNKNEEISLYEFITGCLTWIDEAKQRAESGHLHSSKSLSKLKEVVEQVIKGSKKELEKIPTVMCDILKHFQSLLNQSLLKDGKPDQDSIESLFKKCDTDHDGKVKLDELKNLLPKIDLGDMQHNKDCVAEKLIQHFDKDNDQMVDHKEFVDGFTEVLNEAAQMTEHVEDHEKINEFHRMTWKKAHDLMKEEKEKIGIKNKLLSIWPGIIKASLQVIFGAAIVIFLASPLLANVQHFSKEVGIPSVFTSFVVIPLALNIRMAISTHFPASKKTEKTSSLTFSKMYGEVVMNNILGVLIVLAIIYSRSLTWNYSAEVVVILVVGLIIGLFSFFRTTYPLWACILAISLYPLSILLVYFLDYVWG